MSDKSKVVFRADNGEVKVVTGVRRIDLASAPMKKPELLDNGWMLCDAVLTTTGVFSYANPDGTERRELRLPEDVFHPDSMKSFHLVPVTNNHPDCGWLDSNNTKQYACGTAEMPTRDGDNMRARLMITDATLIQDMRDGKCQVSNGYFADLEMRAGVYDGQPFDCVQKNIRGNHVAIVDEARAGPVAKVKLDAADGVMVRVVQGARPEPLGATVKVKINGVEFEVSDQVAQAMEFERKRQDEAVAEKDAQLTQATAALGKAEGERDLAKQAGAKLDAALKQATDQKNVDAAINARLALVETAREVLGPDFKADGKPSGAIRAEVIAKLAPDLKLDGKPEAQVQAYFEAVMAAQSTSKNDGLAAARRAMDDVHETEHQDGVLHADAPEMKFVKHNQNLWMHYDGFSASKRAANGSRYR